MPSVPGSKQIEFVGDGCLVYRAPSSTRYGLFHYVMLINGEEIRCSCEGFVYSGHCWHADQLEEQLDLLDEAEREGITIDDEQCSLCGKIAEGFATINGKRYCHGDQEETTCYMKANYDESGIIGI